MSETNKPILLLVTSQDWGGVQSFIFDLARELKSRELSVMVCAGGHGELGEKCREAGIPFHGLKYMARDINPVTNFLSLLELIKLFRRKKPQTVHLNSTMMGVIGSMAARLTNVPHTVYCIGGWAFNEQLSAWKKSFYILIEKISAHWKDIIVCVHPGDEAQARTLNIRPHLKLITIPNGIDAEAFEGQLLSRDAAVRTLYPQFFPPSTEERWRVGDETDKGLIIGTVANAYPPKNLIWYLDVCKAVHETRPDIKFIIIGDGPQMDELKRKHEALNQADYVLLTGRRMDATRLYRAFDIFVLPSTKEGMPITLLEAMASHVPIIATDVGANKWMLDDGAGVIVQPNNKDVMVNTINQLASNKNSRRVLSERAQQIVTQKFSWKNTVNETVLTLSPSTTFVASTSPPQAGESNNLL